MNINKLIMAGRLARDPEFKEVRPNLFACKITIATNHETRSKDGQVKKEVCFIDCTLWNQQAKDAHERLKKGSLVVAEGRLATEKWVDPTTKIERTKQILKCEILIIPEPIPSTATTTNDSSDSFDEEMPF